MNIHYSLMGWNDYFKDFMTFPLKNTFLGLIPWVKEIM